MTLTSIPLSLTPSPWLGALLVGLAILYYYSTRTDIPKIKGIPEIPGALPMYPPSPRSQLTIVSAIFSNWATYVIPLTSLKP